MTTLIMPYSNYEDAKAVISLYKNSLSFDGDMNFAEFIGEKLIAPGLALDEEEDAPIKTNKIPNAHDQVVQIQNGVIFHKHEELIDFTTYVIPVKIASVYNVKFKKEKFCPGILRPPSILFFKQS